MPIPPDRFDEVRRKWIARHQHTFIFQKRRQEILARQIRDRAAEKTGARVDPADDDVIHPLPFRRIETIYGALDFLIVLTVGLIAPIGWLVGRFVYRSILQLIPGELRAYPVAAMMWAAVLIGVPPMVLLDAGDTAAGLLGFWLACQVPAIALAAGIYGILEGWLAVAGSRDFWPLRPPPEAEDTDFQLLTPDDMTGPSIFHVADHADLGEQLPINRGDQ